jgi:hypothetical protein
MPVLKGENQAVEAAVDEILQLTIGCFVVKNLQ